MSDRAVPEGEAGLRIRDVVERTGIAEGTLRVWEARHGFPAPERLESGHRRYRERDVELLRQVVRDRDSGLALVAALDRARRSAPGQGRSVYVGLRERRPELQVSRLPKKTLVTISHAIEDHCALGGGDPLIFGSFQRERHYRAVEPRWRALSATSHACLVFADFAGLRRPPGGPAEVPVARTDPLAREWALVCDAPDRGACLAAWEPPGQDETPDGERIFEAVWTVDRDGVRAASRVCCELAEVQAPVLAAGLLGRLEAGPAPSGPDELREAVALANRIVAYLGRPPEVAAATR